MRSSSFSEIDSSLSEHRNGIRVTGGHDSSYSYLLNLLFEKSQGPLFVICPNEDLTQVYLEDLKGFGIDAFAFPTWNPSPFSGILPSINIRNDRITAISQLMSNKKKVVIVGTLLSFSQSTIPAELFKKWSLSFSEIENLTRDEMLVRLAHLGYRRVDPVEDNGTYSVRGDIIDVYPVHFQYPVRIEYFGDILEQVRYFEATSQRTLSKHNQFEQLKTMNLGPAREMIINEDTAASLRINIKKYADSMNISKKYRDPLVESINALQYPVFSDAWAPFAYEKNHGLFDYIDSNSTLVLVEELETKTLFDEELIRLQELHKQTVESNVIVPNVNELYVSHHFEPNLILDKINVLTQNEDGETKKNHSMQVITNQDIQSLEKEKRKSLLKGKIFSWLKEENQIVFLAGTQGQLERVKFLYEEWEFPLHENVKFETKLLSSGFRWPKEKIVFITESEFLGIKKKILKNKQKDSVSKSWSGLSQLEDLKTGDKIVHVKHGIGKYIGLTKLSVDGVENEFLEIQYAGDDKLYLPIYRLNLIQKYVGGGESTRLDKLGSHNFEKAKQKVKNSVKKLAFDLVELYAKRNLEKGPELHSDDIQFDEFEERFPFHETPDQLKAIQDIQSDFSAGRMMDRLICGDVGFGKTEVAIRAAYLAAMNGKQVAVLAPTTLLALQHELSFKERMKEYPLTIESISRFKSKKEQKEILEKLKNGKIDILIGTHRILSADVRFSNLGLMVVDEEHRFGVEHKEKLKAFKLSSHVLTMTATPIPRTLNMALSGIKDMTIMATPPVDRLPIRTFLCKFEEPLLQQAIRHELSRGGQVFFLHNRVDSIFEMAKRIQDMVPEAKVDVGHGKMPETKLEAVMRRFYNKEFNVLVCTTIIEAGIDIPSANTILINHADRFGLAQLYQLRGRVGRSENRGYAYLLVSSTTALSSDAKKRLEVIQRFVDLGSGFHIASHDLEIRGGGNLLGPEQSGHISSVGFDLYTELLNEAIQELKGAPGTSASDEFDPEIKSPYSALLSEEYISDIHQRLNLYRRLSSAGSDEELNSLEAELQDRFGPLTDEAHHLVWTIKIKVLLKKYKIEKLTIGKNNISLFTSQTARLDPSKLVALVSSQPKKYQLTQDSKLIVRLDKSSLRDSYFFLEQLLEKCSLRD